MAEITAPEARPSASLLALADRCVQCGLCLPHCPTYRLDATEAESPRGRIAYIKAVAGRTFAPTEAGDRHLDHCLGCRRCESACPAGVDYGALLVGSRAAQAERTGISRSDRFRLGLLARPRRLRGLLNAYRLLYPLLPARWRLLPRPLHSPSPASGPTSETALFVGCIARAYEGPAQASVLRLLKAVGIDLSVPEAQTCCGTAAIHAGATNQAQLLAAENLAAFAGATRVLCLATGCQESLSASLRGVTEVEDAIAFVESKADSLRFRSAGGRRVALHIPCTQVSLTRSDAPLRRLLARVPDLELIELPDSGCCGAAGMHMVKEPQRAAALREPLARSLASSGAQELLSSNIGCRLHLADACAIPIRHPLEFLAEQLA